MFPMTSPIVQLYSDASEILANWPAARLTIRGRDITKLHPPCYKLHLWELPSSYQAGQTGCEKHLCIFEENHHQRLIQMPSPIKIESLWVFVDLMVGVLSTFLGNFFPTVSCQSATGLLPLVNVTQRCRQHFPRETKVATDMDLTNHKKRKENLFSSNFIGKHWFCAAWIFNHSVCTLCTFQIAFVIGAVAIFCQKHLEICCLNFPVQNQ